MSDSSALEQLRRELAQRGVDAFTEGSEIPVLWVTAGGTRREMVFVNGGRYFMWDGASHDVNDPAGLAGRLAEHVSETPEPPVRHWGQ